MTSTTLWGVHRHRFGEQWENLSEQVTNAVYVQDVLGRDESRITLLKPFQEGRSAVQPGDYITIRDAAGYATSLGRVLTRSSRLTRGDGGTLSGAVVDITTAGWWEYLQRTHIYMLMGDLSGRFSTNIGTLFSTIEWQSIIAALGASYGQMAGQQLQFLFSKVAKVRFPETLGGQWFGDAVPIVHDEDTALRFAPQFKDIEPVDIGALTPDRLVSALDAKTMDVGSLLTSTFVPDKGLIELFPALVDGGTEPYNPLATALGRRPVLVYRIKPWRTDPLWRTAIPKSQYTERDVERFVSAATDPERRAEFEREVRSRRELVERTSSLLVDQKIFNKITLNTGSTDVVVPIPDKYITAIDMQADDARRVNASSVNVTPMGPDDIETFAGSDLPIVVDDQVERHGLRLYRTQWPFIGPDGQVDLAYYRTAAAQAMQFNMYNHLLETGTMNLHYTNALTVTETNGQTQFAPVLRLMHGQWFRTRIGDMDEYLGYVEAIQHTVARQSDGRRGARTVVRFSRGHTVELTGDVSSPIVPIGTRTNVDAAPPPRLLSIRGGARQARPTQPTAYPIGTGPTVRGRQQDDPLEFPVDPSTVPPSELAAFSGVDGPLWAGETFTLLEDPAQQTLEAIARMEVDEGRPPPLTQLDDADSVLIDWGEAVRDPASRFVPPLDIELVGTPEEPAPPPPPIALPTDAIGALIGLPEVPAPVTVPGQPPVAVPALPVEWDTPGEPVDQEALDRAVLEREALYAAPLPVEPRQVLVVPTVPPQRQRVIVRRLVDGTSMVDQRLLDLEDAADPSRVQYDTRVEFVDIEHIRVSFAADPMEGPVSFFCSGPGDPLVAQVTQQANSAYLIEVFGLLPDQRYVLVATSPNATTRRLPFLAAELQPASSPYAQSGTPQERLARMAELAISDAYSDWLAYCVQPLGFKGASRDTMVSSELPPGYFGGEDYNPYMSSAMGSSMAPTPPTKVQFNPPSPVFLNLYNKGFPGMQIPPQGPRDGVYRNWCTAAVIKWLCAGGFNLAQRVSLAHVDNVVQFFTYLQRTVTRPRNAGSNPSRQATEVFLGGEWVDLRQWHQSQDDERVWWDGPSIRAALSDRSSVGDTLLAEVFSPGNLVLTGSDIRSPPAHIAMVAAWDGTTLSTWEGNTTGKTVKRRIENPVVALKTRSRGNLRNVTSLYGVGRLSSLDLGEDLLRNRQGKELVVR